MRSKYASLDKNTKLIWNFRDIGHTMRAIREGKGSQSRILIVLQETGTITQRELTEWLGIKSGSASEVIGKMEAAGLIARSPSASDGRTADIRLTEAGREAAEAACARREARHEQMFSCLSEEETETLLSLLERVNAAWDALYRKKGQ